MAGHVCKYHQLEWNWKQGNCAVKALVNIAWEALWQGDSACLVCAEVDSKSSGSVGNDGKGQ